MTTTTEPVRPLKVDLPQLVRPSRDTTVREVAELLRDYGQLGWREIAAALPITPTETDNQRHVEAAAFGWLQTQCFIASQVLLVGLSAAALDAPIGIVDDLAKLGCRPCRAADCTVEVAPWHDPFDGYCDEDCATNSQQYVADENVDALLACQRDGA